MTSLNEFPFFESIKFNNGRFFHLNAHFKRMRETLKHFYGHERLMVSEEWLRQFSPADAGLFKCRLSYGEFPDRPMFQAYEPKKKTSLKMVFTSGLDYRYKYNDRSRLQELFNRREDKDDVLIVNDGLVTDTHFCNIVFSDGKRWFTPENPLLRGIQRGFLLHQGVIHTRNIVPADLREFKSFKLINAMIDWESAIETGIDAIGRPE